MPELAREVGITQEAAERTLQSASSQYAVHRATASTQISTELNALACATQDVSFPRASIIRRAGAARRRGFTAAGVGVALAALVAAGTFVTDHDGVAPSLSRTESPDSPLAAAPVKPEPPRLEEVELLTEDQAARLDPKARWRTVTTSPNTAGSGLYAPCQAARFADTHGTQTLVRTFRSAPRKGAAAVDAVQATELSRNAARARAAYAATVAWYAGCTAPRTQLLAAYDVPGVGDQASLFLLRTWGREPSTVTVAVARTRQITTTTIRQTHSPRLPSLRPVATLLAAAVNRVCGTPGSGTCAGPPKLAKAPPPPIGDAPGLLDAVDLPKAGSVNFSWSGTQPRRAIQNLASISCDNSDFSRAPVSNGMTRSYLMVKGKLPKQFGITETVGTLPTPPAARKFLDAVRNRLGGCEDKDAASTVTVLTDEHGSHVEMAAWRVETKVTDSDTIDFWMAIVRRGNAVAQIGFVTAPGASFDRDTFLSLAERAVERLAYMPDPK